VLLSTSPVIDGKLGLEEWRQATHITEFKDRVTSQVPAKDPTEAYIGYTKVGIFVAFRCFDSEPDKIIGREIQPNSEFRGEDRVSVTLNLFGTRAFDQLSEFIVNAIGTQTEKLQVGDPINASGAANGKRQPVETTKVGTAK
jgi:hypothetical protein